MPNGCLCVLFLVASLSLVEFKLVDKWNKEGALKFWDASQQDKLAVKIVVA